MPAPRRNLGSEPPSCATPPALSAIDVALERTAITDPCGQTADDCCDRLLFDSGVGATGPTMSYPSRLEAGAEGQVSGREIRVINHGVGGQDVREELGRLDRDVMAEHPDLVIWQFGTNAVLRRDDLSADEELIRRGVGLMKENNIDVVLMDLQYAPRVLARPATAEMERLIAEVAQSTRVGLFRRFEIMQHWERDASARACLAGRPGRAAYDRCELRLPGKPARRGAGVRTGGPTPSWRGRLIVVPTLSPGSSARAACLRPAPSDNADRLERLPPSQASSANARLSSPAYDVTVAAEAS